MSEKLLIIILTLAPEFFGLWAIIWISILGIVTRSWWGQKGHGNMIFTAVLIALSILLFLIYKTEITWYLSGMGENEPYYYIINSNRYISTQLTAYVRFLVIAITILCLLLHKQYFTKKIENNFWEYSLLVLIAAVAMIILVNCNDFLLMFLAFESQTLLLYILVSIKRYSNFAVEAAVKFFMMAAFGSTVMAFGISLLYLETGSTGFVSSAILLIGKDNLFVSYLIGITILTGFLFKFALIPMHFWIGDVFQGSYGYFASFIALVTKLSTLIVFIKILIYFWAATPYLIIVIRTIALISLIISTILIVKELNFKRFWAFSSINHMGYIVLLLTTGNHNAIGLTVVYMIIYLFSGIGIWTLILRARKNPSHNITLVEFFTKLPRLSVVKINNTLYTFSVCMLFLSVAGLPPAIGFLPKFLIFWQFYQNGDLLAIIVIFITQMISITYYLRTIRYALFQTPTDPISEEIITGATWIENFLFIIISLLTIWIGFYFFDIMSYMQYLGWEFLKTLIGVSI